MSKQLQYLDSKGGICPECGSHNIDGYEIENAVEDTILGHVACSDCGATWDEVYKLAHAVDLLTGDGQLVPLGTLYTVVLSRLDDSQYTTYVEAANPEAAIEAAKEECRLADTREADWDYLEVVCVMYGKVEFAI